MDLNRLDITNDGKISKEDFADLKKASDIQIQFKTFQLCRFGFELKRYDDTDTDTDTEFNKTYVFSLYIHVF